MLLRQPLTTVFGGSRARVLDALLDLQGGLSVREMARLTGLSATTASSALQALYDIGLVSRRAVGQNLVYEVSPEHVLIAPLRAVSSRVHDVDDLVAREVKRSLGRAMALWLYGSRATGNERPSSDADLVAVFRTTADAGRAAPHAPPLQERLAALLGYPVSLTCTAVPTPDQWRSPFWENVLSDGAALAGPTPLEVHDHGGDASKIAPWQAT